MLADDLRKKCPASYGDSKVRNWLSTLTTKCLCLCLCLIVSTAISTLILPAPAQAQAATSGELFSQHCAACHVNGGNIIRRGKTLKQKALRRNGYETVEAIASLISQGKGAMPAFSDRLTSEETEAIAHYVQTQAANNWKN